eukprot:CAMPEP_0118905298 /NCGR_PEP_ID=MMETSP1166-20130328/9375_1 /TAXON_ID=1104430 /ORGANISM="Chrysoreinhardia sp, Strain CCMP3193" /LENGTH=402 /DNA_ID=CAMNT_0006844569 /DNA_START=130 /DNA_END=1338 /DNA_ORIENTATION=-
MATSAALKWVGLDLGGTNAKAAVVDDSGSVLAYRWAPLVARGPRESKGLAPAEVVAQLMACAETALEACGVTWGEIRGVGIGTPGAVEGGDVLAAGNLFENRSAVPLRRLVKEAVGVDVPTVLLNDADAALRAELWVSGKRNAAMLTLGTGVGCALAFDGRVVAGRHLEGGHMLVDSTNNGRPCACGSRGCLEAHASAPAVARDYYERTQRRLRSDDLCVQDDDDHKDQDDDDDDDDEKEEGLLSCEDVFARADYDETAKAVVDDAAKFVAVGCVNLLRILDPDVLVLAGGVANAGDKFLDAVRTHVKRLSWTCLPANEHHVVLAAAGDHTGCIGAAKAAKDDQEERRGIIGAPPLRNALAGIDDDDDDDDHGGLPNKKNQRASCAGGLSCRTSPPYYCVIS